MKNLLTRVNIDWLFKEAISAQGCHHPDDCDANQEELRAMKVQFDALLERDRQQDKRDATVIKQFLASKGLREL